MLRWWRSPPKKVRVILFTTLCHFIIKKGQIICIDILFFWSVMMSTNEKKQGHMQNQIRVHSGSLKNPLRSGLKNKKTETDSLNDLTCLTEKLHTLRLISNLYSHLKCQRYSFILLLLFVILPSDYCCKTTWSFLQRNLWCLIGFKMSYCSIHAN